MKEGGKQDSDGFNRDLIGWNVSGLVFANDFSSDITGVTFVALSCGQKPDHSTIAVFVLSMKDEAVSLLLESLDSE